MITKIHVWHPAFASRCYQITSSTGINIQTVKDLLYDVMDKSSLYPHKYQFNITIGGQTMSNHATLQNDCILYLTFNYI